jgi:hypothetical protein
MSKRAVVCSNKYTIRKPGKPSVGSNGKAVYWTRYVDIVYPNRTKPTYDMAIPDCRVIPKSVSRLTGEFNTSVVGLGIPIGVYKALVKEVSLVEPIADPNTSKVKFAEEYAWMAAKYWGDMENTIQMVKPGSTTPTPVDIDKMFEKAKTSSKPVNSIKCTVLVKMALKGVNDDVSSCKDIALWDPSFTLIHMLVESVATEVGVSLVASSAKAATIEASNHVADSSLLDLM